MINSILIEQRLALITGYLVELKQLAKLPPEEFLSDNLKTAATESYLRRSLEAIFDIGRHILAKTGAVDLATEYKAIARGLSQKQIIDQKLGLKLVEMAGYRNRLVHLYNEVSNEELYHILVSDLNDIRSFVIQIHSYMNQRNSQE